MKAINRLDKDLEKIIEKDDGIWDACPSPAVRNKLPLEVWSTTFDRYAKKYSNLYWQIKEIYENNEALELLGETKETEVLSFSAIRVSVGSLCALVEGDLENIETKSTEDIQNQIDELREKIENLEHSKMDKFLDSE